LFPANILLRSNQYWLQAYNIIVAATKEHFNYQGCVARQNWLNFGLSYSLKEAFPDFNFSLIDQMSNNFRGIPQGMWLAGFASGDGSFYTKLTQYKDTFHTCFASVFKITLHLKDTALLEGLYDYLSKYL
jgi:hypothetical protein